MPRVITVFGATGLQASRSVSISNHEELCSKNDILFIGGSVVNCILADGTFTPRAVTRDPDSDASKKLNARGVQVVKGDLNDKDALKKVIAGSEGMFGVCVNWPLSIVPIG